MSAIWWNKSIQTSIPVIEGTPVDDAISGTKGSPVDDLIPGTSTKTAATEVSHDASGTYLFLNDVIECNHEFEPFYGPLIFP